MEKPEVTYTTEIDDKKGIETIDIKFQLPKMDIIYHVNVNVGRYTSSVECLKQGRQVPLISEVIESNGLSEHTTYVLRCFRHQYLLNMYNSQLYLIGFDNVDKQFCKTIFQHSFEIERGE